MLGRKAGGREVNARGPKKRKWQESDDGSSQEAVTHEDMEAWRQTMREEEKQEQLEQQRHEAQKAAEEAEAEQLREEERKAEEEAERRRKEEPVGVSVEVSLSSARAGMSAIAPPGALPPDFPSLLPPGLWMDKAHLYKTTYCKRWESATCQFGAACYFAHGERELRGRPPRGSPPGTMSVPLAGQIKPPPGEALLAGPVSSVPGVSGVPGAPGTALQVQEGLLPSVQCPQTPFGAAMDGQLAQAQNVLHPQHAAAALSLLRTLLAGSGEFGAVPPQ